jgi:hypothetical protein
MGARTTGAWLARTSLSIGEAPITLVRDGAVIDEARIDSDVSKRRGADGGGRVVDFKTDAEAWRVRRNN